MKKIFINLIIISITIYTPLFLYCLLWTFSAKTLKLTSTNIKNYHNKKVKLKKIESINKGLLPIYKPLDSKKYVLKNNVYPIGSLPNTLSYYCDEGLGLIKYKTDRFGLRNIDSKWNKITKKSNIFVIGDSFTHGACVNNSLTIPEIINNKTNINTLNLGSGGNSPYEYMALMKTIVSPAIFNSDNQNWVLMIFYINDNIRYKKYSEKLFSEAKPIVSSNPNGDIYPTNEYHENIRKLIMQNLPTNKNILIKNLKNTKNSNFSVLIYSLKLSPILVELNEIIKSYDSIKLLSNPSTQSIHRLSKICKKNCNPLIAYIPHSSFWYPAPEYKNNKYKKQLKDISLKLNIPFIDGSRVIDRNNLHDYSPKGIHLSPQGYKKIGELISSEIKFLNNQN